MLAVLVTPHAHAGLAVAYEARPTLFYDAARDGVLIAGPATLLSILWSIAHGLQHDARARHGQEIGESAAELHRRLGGDASSAACYRLARDRSAPGDPVGGRQGPRCPAGRP